MPTLYYAQSNVWARRGRTSIANPAATFTLGTTKPDATNSGLAVNNPSLTVVTATSSDYVTHATDGAVFNNMDFQCYVLTTGKGITYNNCSFKGPATIITTRTGLVTTNTIASQTDFPTFNYCYFRPQVTRYYLNCLKGGATVYRCELTRGCDLINTTQPITCKGSWLHDTAFFDGSTGTEHGSDTRFPGATHNDGLQIFAGTGHLIEGNNIQAYFATDVGTPNSMKPWNGGGSGQGLSYTGNNYTNGITVTPQSGSATGTLKNNWMEGGEILLQVPAQGAGYDSGNDWVITGNRYGCDQHPYGTSYQQMRWSVGMGTFTVDSTNIYDSAASVPAGIQGMSLASPTNNGSQITYAVTKS